MVHKSETWDEGLFIAGGIFQVTHLNTNFDLTHPPLLRWLAGLGPVLFADAIAPDHPPVVSSDPIDLYAYKVADCFSYARRTFYEVGNDHNQILYRGRLPFAIFAIGTSWLIFFQLRNRVGTTTAFLSASTFLFLPEVLAHAQWAHSDLASACTILLMSVALSRALVSPSPTNDVSVGILLGISITTKFTALLLVPFVACLLGYYSSSSGQHSRSLVILKRISMVSAIAYTIVVLSYYPDSKIFHPHLFLSRNIGQVLNISHESKLNEIVTELLAHLPVPDSFIKGVVYTRLLSQRGLPAFLNGEIRLTGWLYYFPIAVFLKYPLVFLVVSLGGLVAVWRTQNWVRAEKICLVGPPLLMFAAATVQGVNIGVRNVLFIAPFMALWIGVLAGEIKKSSWRYLVFLLCLMSSSAGVLSYPNFLTYFNPIMGGAKDAHKWLADSNVDWGQDLPMLAEALERRGITEIRLAYFGVADPRHWGIHGKDPTEIEKGWYAISRTLLTGLYSGDQYLWLNDFEVQEYVGGAMVLIYVTDDQANTVRIAEAVRARHRKDHFIQGRRH